MKSYLKNTQKSTIFSLLIAITVMFTAALSINAYSTQSNNIEIAENSQIEAIFKLPHYVEFSGGGDGPLICGPYNLMANKHYTLTIAWEEGGEKVVEVIERIDSKDAAITEYTVTSGHPFLFKVPETGLYRIRISKGARMKNIIYVFQETPM